MGKCRRGHIGPIVDADPRRLASTVHVDSVCLSCAEVVFSTSYSNAMWNVMKRVKKAAPRKKRSTKCIRPYCDQPRASARHKLCRVHSQAA